MRQMERIIRWMNLVSFHDIADWCSMVRGNLTRDEGRREQAHRDLLEATQRGEFGPIAKPVLAYISPGVGDESWRSRVRLLPGQARYVSPACIFTTKALAAKWFSAGQISLPPWLQGVAVGKQVRVVTRAATRRVRPTSSRGRPPKYDWDRALTDLAAEFHANGLPEAGDSRQAKMEQQRTRPHLRENQG